MVNSLCCNCLHFDITAQNGKKGCFGICKMKGILGTLIECNSRRDGKTECLKFESKWDNTKVDYYNGRSCLSHIKNFFAFHDFLSPNETFYIGNIIKYLWRYKKKNGVKDLEKAKQYLEFLIEEQRKEEIK